MPCFARFSPKLRWLSLAPRALALTFIPGASFCCALAINSKSPLGSGLKRNDLIIMTAPAATKSTIAIPKALYNREYFIICSDQITCSRSTTFSPDWTNLSKRQSLTGPTEVKETPTYLRNGVQSTVEPGNLWQEYRIDGDQSAAITRIMQA